MSHFCYLCLTRLSNHIEPGYLVAFQLRLASQTVLGPVGNPGGTASLGVVGNSDQGVGNSLEIGIPEKGIDRHKIRASRGLRDNGVLDMKEQGREVNLKAHFKVPLGSQVEG